jgi:hypothetical protein
MSGLRVDMSNQYQICPVWGHICSIQQDNVLRKNRLGAKMMNLDPDKLTTSKQDTIEHIEIKGTIRCNLNTMNHT